MANKTRIWTVDELKKYDLVDTTGRPLPQKEVVEVYCRNCRAIGTSKFCNLITKMINQNKTWICKTCATKENSERGKKLTGSNNPMYGKKHSKETCAQMKSSSRKRWDNTPANERERIGQNIRTACKEKYGTNVMNVPEIHEKQKQKLNEFMQDAEKFEQREQKRKDTCFKKYGVEHPHQNEQIKDKVKDTCLERYGTESALSSQEIKDKIKRTNRERWGVDNPLSSQEIKDKIKATNMEKYGMENAGATPEAREKIKATCLKRYGVEHFFLSDEFAKMKEHWSWYVSKGELEVLNYVKSLGFDARKRCKNGYEIDIFIPELNLGIEYHGLYWHSEKNVKDDYHYQKLQKAKKDGIKLIQIFEHEWRGRQEQVKGRLQALLGKNEKIFARKTKLIELDSTEAIRFINKYHIQPLQSSGLFLNALGLQYNDELVAVAIISKHHRQGRNSVVLSRFCCKSGLTVIGGLSRLSKHLAQKHDKVVSWCDLRWSDGSGYIEAGWEQEETLRPDYFYFNINTYGIVSKQSRRKGAAGTPEGVTEHQHALADGLLRVYDCGKIRFFKNLKNN